MSIVPPTTPLIPSVVPYPTGPRPWNNTTPFTYVSGVTFQEEFYGFKNFVETSIIPFVDDNVKAVIESFIEQSTDVVNKVNDALESQSGVINAALTAQVETINTAMSGFNLEIDSKFAEQAEAATAQLTAQNTAVTNQLSAQNTTVTNQLTAQNTYVTETVEAITTGSIPVTDPVIAANAKDQNSQTVGALDDGYFPFREIFSNIAGYAYGNSWIAFPQYGAQQYPMRMPARIGLASMANYANSAFRIQDTAINAIGPFIPPFSGKTAYPWTVNTKGIVIIGDLLNNQIEADDQRNRDTALESARALCAILSASSRIEETNVAFTYTGAAWTTLTKDQLSGGTAKYISAWNPTLGEENNVTYVDVAVPAGVNYLLFTATDGAVQGADLNVYDGATLLGTVHTNRRSLNTGLRSNDGRGPVVFRVPGTTARTLRIKAVGAHTGGGTLQNFAIVDALLPQMTEPPLIIFVKPDETTIATHNKPALHTYLRTIPDVCAAEFGNHVISVDSAPGWNPATMVGPDGLHPDEDGYAHITEFVQAAIKTATLKRLAVKMNMV